MAITALQRARAAANRAAALEIQRVRRRDEYSRRYRLTAAAGWGHTMSRVNPYLSQAERTRISRNRGRALRLRAARRRMR